MRLKKPDFNSLKFEFADEKTELIEIEKIIRMLNKKQNVIGSQTNNYLPNRLLSSSLLLT